MWVRGRTLANQDREADFCFRSSGQFSNGWAAVGDGQPVSWKMFCDGVTAGGDRVDQLHSG